MILNYLGKNLAVVLVLYPFAMTLWAGGTNGPASSGAVEPSSSGEYNEAPMLATLVAAGALPPVRERLPSDPVVLTMERNAAPDGLLIDMLEIGDYGGTLKLCANYGSLRFVARCLSAEQLLNRPGWISLAHPLTANIHDHYEESEDSRVFTFRIRHGLKWSDGELVTTDDVQFNFSDILNNESIHPDGSPSVWPTWISSVGEQYNLVVVDELTYRIEFSNPTPGFLDVINLPWMDYTRFIQPKHYLTQFHIDYADPNDLEAMINEYEFDDWTKLFESKWFILGEELTADISEVPVLHPWKLVEIAPKRAVFERNPYYFKTDARGSQLPYIDEILVILADGDLCDSKALSGEIDFHTARLPSLPLYQENATRGNYRAEVTKHGYLYRPIVYAFNFTLDDEQWQSIVSDHDFRKALNLSIDRK